MDVEKLAEIYDVVVIEHKVLTTPVKKVKRKESDFMIDRGKGKIARLRGHFYPEMRLSYAEGSCHCQWKGGHEHPWSRRVLMAK